VADLKPAAGEGKNLSPPRCRVVHAWVTEERYAAIERAANEVRKHPDQIVAELLDQAFDPEFKYAE
jgi:hypothetical protein